MTSQLSEYLGRAHSEIKLTLMITNSNLMRHYINMRRLGLITNILHMIIFFDSFKICHVIELAPFS